VCACGTLSVQVALRWVAQHGVPLVTRASSLEYLAEDIDIFDFALSPTDLTALDSATKPNATTCLFCSGAGPHA
jgi:diketogulonate reductase-like aldo/keto reductase